MSGKTNQKLSTKPTNRETREQSNSSKPNDKPVGSSKPANEAIAKFESANHRESIDQLVGLEERAKFSSDEESDHEMDNGEVLVEQDYHSSGEDQAADEELDEDIDEERFRNAFMDVMGVVLIGAALGHRFGNDDAQQDERQDEAI